MADEQSGGASSDKIETELEEGQFHVTIHAIEFERDQEQYIERVVFQFRLHGGDGWTTLPVTITKLDDSVDEMVKTALSTLYLILASLAETTRRKADLPKISFKDSP